MSEETWHPARLIPVSGIGSAEEQERRATSALLAVTTAVREFARALLKPLGAPSGSVAAYCEVPFEIDGRTVRPDGLVRVRHGKTTWTVLVEVKTGASQLESDQLELYLEVVGREGLDGLLTISNEIAQVAGHHPVRVNQKKYRKVPLHHISWLRLLTLAVMVKEHQGVSDPDQAWLLGELIRYLQYDRSGAMTFEDMGPHWVAIRQAVRTQTLRSKDDGLSDLAQRWDQLLQYVCLDLGARLGEQVKPVLTREELNDPAFRTENVARQLVDEGVLAGGVHIPNAIAPIMLMADLRAMMATASVEVQAPKLKRSTTRVNWMTRQLRAAPEELRIDARFVRVQETTSALLSAAREDPRALLLANGREIRSFHLALTSEIGTKRRRGRGSFIDDIAGLTERFYRDVVQGLKPWTEPAPKLKAEPQPRPEESDRGAEEPVTSDTQISEPEHQ